MTEFKSILCPVDLSENSLAAVELATSLAKQSGAKLDFIYVAPQWLPEEAMFGSEYIRETVAEEKSEFLKIRPTSSEVEFDHLFVNGNPGPEIVRATASHDLVVICTHGRSGLFRILMGSVAQYVLRHAACPVITYRASSKKRSIPTGHQESEPKHFVSDLMHHITPIHGYEKMDVVTSELEKAKQTAAPVVDEMGNCLGILTESDIKKYRDLQQRYENRDESVVDEIFEVDEYGQRRAGACTFDQVHRHMTSPVISISSSGSCQKAQKLFDSNKNIHHLVVVDEQERPIGIVKSHDLLNRKILSQES
jgi:universal stress protein A